MSMTPSEKIKAKYGEDWHSIIGAKGGYAKYRGKRGFAANPELSSKLGSKGGKLGKRGKTFLRATPTYLVYQDKKTGEIVKYKRVNS